MDAHIKEKALQRHMAVSVVLARTVAGFSVRAAIGAVLHNGFVTLSTGQRLRVSSRTLHRWVERYRAKGFDALAPASRKLPEPSRILPAEFVEFLVTQKGQDPEASIPDIIRSAEKLGMVREGELSRTENKHSFLRGLYLVILHFGKMLCIYVDNGSGFISKDGYIICARLGIHIINGTAAYPEGHGKVERYNRTQYADLLRTLPGDPSVGDTFPGLETRIGHYAFNLYNNRHHESLDRTPNEKWRADSNPLRVVDDKDALAREFVITKTHKVSADNIVKAGGQLLEMPFGYAGTKVEIAHDLLEKKARFLHDGKIILLKPVNLVDNAKTKRRGKPVKPEKPHGPIRTAARIAFDKDFASVVTDDGDFVEPNHTREE